MATRVGGTPDIITHGQNGLLIPPKTPVALGKAVLRLFENESERRQLIEKGLAYIRKNHHHEKTMTGYKNFYLHWYHEKRDPPGRKAVLQMAKAILGNFCDAIGSMRLQDKRKRKPIYIVNYHRILHAHEIRHYLFMPMVQNALTFERQIDNFKRRCHVISLEECVRILQGGAPIPDRAVVLTFDDAYGDVYHVAQPILEKYEVPATVFLPVGIIDQIGFIWYDEIADRLQYIDVKSLLNMNDLSDGVKARLQSVRALNPDDQDLIARRAIQLIIDSPHPERHYLVENLLDFEAPENGVGDNSLLTWEQIAEMSRSGLFTFGSHSMNHEPLDLLPYPYLKHEIGGSKQLMEEKTGKPVDFFSFPLGRHNRKTRELVRRFDYKAVVILTDSPNFHGGDDTYALKRTDAAYFANGERYHEGFMTAELCGVSHFFRSRMKALQAMRVKELN